jgi:hypothetical protein
MGELAEDTIDGACCWRCGVYFFDPDTDEPVYYDHPVLCLECVKAMPKAEKKAYLDKGGMVSIDYTKPQ